MTIIKTKFPQMLFGLILILFGMNGFFSFLPIPEKQGFAVEFMHVLHQTHYILPIVATIMTTTGLLLLLNKGENFGLLILLPVSFNIFAFHLFHDLPGLAAASVLFGMNIYLILKRLNQFKPLFN